MDRSDGARCSGSDRKLQHSFYRAEPAHESNSKFYRRRRGKFRSYTHSPVAIALPYRAARQRIFDDWFVIAAQISDGA